MPLGTVGWSFLQVVCPGCFGISINNVSRRQLDTRCGPEIWCGRKRSIATTLLLDSVKIEIILRMAGDSSVNICGGWYSLPSPMNQNLSLGVAPLPSDGLCPFGIGMWRWS